MHFYTHLGASDYTWCTHALMRRLLAYVGEMVRKTWFVLFGAGAATHNYERDADRCASDLASAYAYAYVLCFCVCLFVFGWMDMCAHAFIHISESTCSSSCPSVVVRVCTTGATTGQSEPEQFNRWATGAKEAVCNVHGLVQLTRCFECGMCDFPFVGSTFQKSARRWEMFRWIFFWDCTLFKYFVQH